MQFAHGFGGSQVDLESLAPGASFEVEEFIVNLTPQSTEWGSVQVCVNRGAGIALGSTLVFDIESQTVETAPHNQSVAITTAQNNVACSDAIPVLKGSFAIVRSVNNGFTAVGDVQPGGPAGTDILAGSSLILIANNPVQPTFFIKALGNAGCGAGYYKTHTSSFPARFPTDLTAAVLGSDSLTNATLLDLLRNPGTGGDPVATLGRSAATALLNAGQQGVSFPWTINQTLSLSADAYASGIRSQMLAAASQLDGLNSGSCPLK